MSLLSELKRRRVPQFFGLYLGAGWGVLQFVDWLAKRYLLPNALTDAVLLTLVSFAPAVLLLAWSHGAPGRDRWGRAEKIGLPVNALVTIILLVSFLHGRDLGATAQRVTVTDEAGETVERLVPKTDHRRDIGLFFWDNATDDPELHWLRYGLPLFLEQDLAQDPYLLVYTPYSGWEQYFFSRLVRAGFNDGLDVPVALQRKLAKDFHMGYFADGSVGKTDAGYVLELTLYRVEPATTVAELRVEGPELLGLVDLLTDQLKEALDIPIGSERLANDLPVTEHMSASLEALKAFVDARTALLLHNDRAGAIERLSAAAELDPTFALAQSEQASLWMQSGESTEALEAAQHALRHDYRLSERDRFQLKSSVYRLRGEVDKAIAVYEMWTELFPDDTTALATLANQYAWNGNRIDDAIATYERLRVIDPNQDWVLHSMARLWLSKGDVDRARGLYERYAELHPDEIGSWTGLAGLHILQGELDKARDLFEKAELLSTDSVFPLTYLADLDLRQGDWQAAEARLEQAAGIASDVRSQAQVCRARLETLEQQGRMVEYIQQLERLEGLEEQYRSPMKIISDLILINMERWVEACLPDEGSARLRTIEAELTEPPFDRIVSFGRMLFHLAEGNADAAEPWIEEMEQFLADLNREDLEFHSSRARGQLALLRGRPDTAAEQFSLALELFDSSSQRSTNTGFRLRLLVDLGRAYRLAGNVQDARNRLEEALKVFPVHPKANLELALLAEQERRYDDARAYLDQTFILWHNADEGYPPAREARELATRLVRQDFRAAG